jgi:chromosome segregation ATPase
MERERELRAQLANNNVSSVIGDLRAENDGLRADNDYLREQVEILVQNAQKHVPELESRKLQHASLLSEKERLASEATEALSALRSELEMRTQAYEDQMAQEKTRVQQLAEQMAELEENLVEARNLLTAADDAANAVASHNELLEKDMANNGRRIAEQEADINGLREQNAQLTEESAQKDELNKSLQKSLQEADESGKHEREMLSMQVEEHKRKISTLVLEIQQAQNDARAARDELR